MERIAVARIDCLCNRRVRARDSQDARKLIADHDVPFQRNNFGGGGSAPVDDCQGVLAGNAHMTEAIAAGES